MVYVLMTEDMDWEQRDSFDETLEGMDVETDRRNRFEVVRAMQGGDVVLSSREGVPTSRA